ncbi:hypothetical protein [Lewinella sp. 4G2]|uniref:hypothetical protein n=1 Tax=Lewinella sp. 4G2 TaxID=1803372 RepID=UPI0007B484F2|nr:hypothetical protein [Lewinella sp. 4G2]OAV43412.1 hypothetical protein A3850_002375 [Lewinella sp. 4G2]
MRILLSLFFVLIAIVSADAQLAPPAEGKAVVYIVRAPGNAMLVNFRYYDGDQLLGRFNAGKYLRYECEPGEHVFWARSENRSYVEADLEAGGIYVLESAVLPGGLKARVALVPVVKKGDKDVRKWIRKMINKKDAQTFTDAELAEWSDKVSDATDRGTERYENRKEKGKRTKQMGRTSKLSLADLKI